MEKVILHSRNTAETIRIGKEVGRRLHPADVVALVGELGAGKTHFIKGLASGAGVRKSKYLTSPSFTLINEYPGAVPFYHVDLYRLETRGEADELGLEEYVQSGGITVIEWADRIPSLIPHGALWVKIEYRGGQTREIQVTGEGDRWDGLAEELSSLAIF